MPWVAGSGRSRAASPPPAGGPTSGQLEKARPAPHPTLTSRLPSHRPGRFPTVPGLLPALCPLQTWTPGNTHHAAQTPVRTRGLVPWPPGEAPAVRLLCELKETTSPVASPPGAAGQHGARRPGLLSPILFSTEGPRAPEPWGLRDLPGPARSWIPLCPALGCGSLTPRLGCLPVALTRSLLTCRGRRRKPQVPSLWAGERPSPGVGSAPPPTSHTLLTRPLSQATLRMPGARLRKTEASSLWHLHLPGAQQQSSSGSANLYDARLRWAQGGRR